MTVVANDLADVTRLPEEQRPMRLAANRPPFTRGIGVLGDPIASLL
jgi:hypothetical protein